MIFVRISNTKSRWPFAAREEAVHDPRCANVSRPYSCTEENDSALNGYWRLQSSMELWCGTRAAMSTASRLVGGRPRDLRVPVLSVFCDYVTCLVSST